MTKLCIVDLDGVIADSTERFKRAETVKRWHEANLRDALKPELTNPANLSSVQKGVADLLENLYWQTAFTPELIALDTLIDGADKAISRLELADYDVIYLTSRPESLRQATYDWLLKHHLAGPKLVMKASAFQYTKTAVWKAGIVQTLASLYDAEEIVFVDDQEENCEALRKASSLEGLTHLWCYHSLAEAIAEKCRQCRRNDLPLNAESGLCVRCVIDTEQGRKQ